MSNHAFYSHAVPYLEIDQQTGLDIDIRADSAQSRRGKQKYSPRNTPKVTAGARKRDRGA
jgi:hypothetical protein